MIANTTINVAPNIPGAKIQQSPRVIMLQDADKPWQSATSYGEVVRIYDGDEPRPSFWDNEYIVEAMFRLEEMSYDPQTDYILVVGYMVAVTKLVAAIGAKYKVFKALLYDAPRNGYVPNLLGFTVRDTTLHNGETTDGEQKPNNVNNAAPLSAVVRTGAGLTRGDNRRTG